MSSVLCNSLIFPVSTFILEHQKTESFVGVLRGRVPKYYSYLEIHPSTSKEDRLGI